MRILLDHGGYGLANAGDTAMIQVAARRLLNDDRVDRVQVLTDAFDAFAEINIPGEPLNHEGKRLLLAQWNTMGPLRSARNLLGPAVRDRGADIEDRFRRNFQAVSVPLMRARILGRKQHTEHFNDFFRTVKESDALCIAGGGYLNDSFLPHALSVLELAEWFIRQGKPVAMFGQGIGPATNPRLRRKLASVLPHCTIIGLREGIVGPQILRELNITGDHVVVTGDDAIELVLDTADQQGQVPKDSIGMNIRMAEYSGFNSQEGSQIFEAIAEVAAEKGLGIQPVPISWHAGERDIDSVSSAIQIDSDRLLALQNPQRPQAVMQAVARCAAVFTGSYHAAVFALAQGIPVIALSTSAYYDAKFAGLAEQFRNMGIVIVRPQEVCTPRGIRAVLEKLLVEQEDAAPQQISSAKRQAMASEELYRRFLAAVSERSPGAERVCRGS